MSDSENKVQKKKSAFFSIYYRPVRAMQFVYDDIVDSSHYIPTAEVKRGHVSDSSGAGDIGLYDYQANQEVNPKTRISETELFLRSGKLDKADVQTLRNIRVNQMLDEKSREALEEADRSERTRQGKLDALLGIKEDGSENTNTPSS